VVVKISSGAELLNPVVKKQQSSTPLNSFTKGLIGRVLGVESLHRLAIRHPDVRTELQPTFPIGSPHNLLNELFSDLKRVTS
jgi:hypothetical protein